MNIILLTFLMCTSISAEKYLVTTADQLKELVNSASPGDTIMIRDGSFDTDGSVTIRNNGTIDDRIVIMAESLNGVNFVNESYFDFRECSYITLSGFVFSSSNITAVKLQASNHIRITNNIFRINETSSRKWLVVGGIWDDPNALSHDNRIDHNIFENKSMPGNFITIDGSPEPAYKSSMRDTIDHNYFRNNNPRTDNEKESIRVGWSELSESSGYTVIEYNLFEDCNGDPEIISVKTCDNTVRYNTFRRCKGTLSLRHGNRSQVYGNYFFGEGIEGTGGIRLYGDDHLIYNNYFQGLAGTIWDAPITMTNGDYDGGSNLSKHFRINRAVIIFNTLVNNKAGIEIGFTNNGNYTKPPRDVVIANNIVVGNQNDLVRTFTEPVNMIWQGNIMFPTSPANLGIEAEPGEIKNVDPELEYDDFTWRLTNSSPAINTGSGQWDYVIDDMDGQERDTLRDVGADEYSILNINLRPLTPEDVGPGSDNVTSIYESSDDLNDISFQLSQNYPNPFNGITNIPVNINVIGNYSVKVYDISGELVKNVYTGYLNAGIKLFTIDMNEFSSGTYFCRLTGESYTECKKLLFIK